MNSPQRLHSLDNLRALMMWLGIVLHAGVNYMAGPSPLPWRDKATSPAADLILAFIHTFRMPVFFILAGFFVAMLVARRGYGGMLKHRLRRLALPFVVFWPPIFIGMGLLAGVYFHLMKYGTFGLDPSLAPHDPNRPLIGTLHMWFIYYLMWFCLLTAIAGRLAHRLPTRFREGIAAAWAKLTSAWWGFLVLALPLAAVGAFYRDGILVVNGSFIPNLPELVQNGVFFMCGWYLYGRRDTLLPLFMRRGWLYAAAGLFFFFASGAIVEASHRSPFVYAGMGIAYVYGCASWLWSFALIGLFLRYLPTHNRVLAYLADSSYWVYLVHMLGTIGFGVLLYNAPLGALSKMGINIVATSAVCLLTYQLFVRYTPVGTLLNGRRLSRDADGSIGKEISPA